MSISTVERERTGTADRPPRIAAIRTLLPGLVLTGTATAGVLTCSRFVPAVSPLLIAILLGAVTANTVAVPARCRPGSAFAAKQLLRLGIALLGLKLMFGDILSLGAGMIAVVVAIVVLGIGGTMLLGMLLGIDWKQRLLIACGFSICGAAAVAAVDGVADAEEEEVLTAVALVVVFGTCMIPAVPLLSRTFGLDESVAGLWAGGSIHEVAQVVAAGSAIGSGALALAVVVKLARVVMLAPVVAVVSIRMRRTGDAGGSRRPAPVPLFVIGFLGCAALRSAGIVPNSVLAAAAQLQTGLLTAAMFALGAGVSIATMRRIGMRPFVLAFASTVWVAGIALCGVLLAS